MRAAGAKEAEGETETPDHDQKSRTKIERQEAEEGCVTSGSTLLALGLAIAFFALLVLLWEDGRIGGPGPFRDAVQERLQNMHAGDRSYLRQIRLGAVTIGIFLALLGGARLTGWY